MMDFAAARRMMVDGQVRTSDVTEPSLLRAMLTIPRERFVPADKAALAYLDLDLPVLAAGPGTPAGQDDAAGQARHSGNNGHARSGDECPQPRHRRSCAYRSPDFNLCIR